MTVLFVAALLAADPSLDDPEDVFIEPPTSAEEPDEPPKAEEPDGSPAPAPDPATDEDTQRVDPVALDFECPPSSPSEDVYVICAEVDLDDHITYASVYPEVRGVILPNRPILVQVRHPNDRRVTITATGKVGAYTPSVLKFGELPGAKGGDRQFVWTVTERLLPPRTPGEFKVSISLGANGSRGDVEKLDVDLAVEQTYLGAVRVGIGLVGLDATNAEYESRTSVGSQQAEIIAGDPSDLEFELVIGYAAYLDRGGRPASGCAYRPLCFAPYVGVGVLTPDSGDDGVRFLSSVHAGIEWEPSPTFSIAATVVGRRVDRLGTGLLIGGPAPDDDSSLTRQTFGLGAGIVFNVSSEFFSFATKGAKSFL